MKKYISIIRKCMTSKASRFNYLAAMGFYDKMSDEEYLKRKFKYTLGYDLDLNNPKTFNEKLQWLKLYDQKPEYTIMVDKYLVRDYISSIIGKQYLIPLLNVWESPDAIDFTLLPEQFVLKCNHNSGIGMYICRDRSKMDVSKVKEALKKGFKENYYLQNREWPYKNVPKRIIAEKYMSDSTGITDTTQSTGLTDYKFYCFHGEPKYLYVSQGLENHETARISFLNLDWSFADFRRIDYLPLEKLPKRPVKYMEMLQIVRILSRDIPFLRVDLYEIHEKIYFGELTFSPCAGMMPFDSRKSDLKLGELLEI